jgi:hypothetical protein
VGNGSSILRMSSSNVSFTSSRTGGGGGGGEERGTRAALCDRTNDIKLPWQKVDDRVRVCTCMYGCQCTCTCACICSMRAVRECKCTDAHMRTRVNREYHHTRAHTRSDTVISNNTCTSPSARCGSVSRRAMNAAKAAAPGVCW